MFALSEPGKLDDLLAEARLAVHGDDEIDCPVGFDDAKIAERALLGAGPTQLAIGQSGAQAIAQAVREALSPFTEPDGRVTLPTWYRVVIARTKDAVR
jgi:hypothetical protein